VGTPFPSGDASATTAVQHPPLIPTTWGGRRVVETQILYRRTGEIVVATQYTSKMFRSDVTCTDDIPVHFQVTFFLTTIVISSFRFVLVATFRASFSCTVF
jgi:hypothetical protein